MPATVLSIPSGVVSLFNVYQSKPRSGFISFASGDEVLTHDVPPTSDVLFYRYSRQINTDAEGDSQSHTSIDFNWSADVAMFIKYVLNERAIVKRDG